MNHPRLILTALCFCLGLCLLAPSVARAEPNPQELFVTAQQYFDNEQYEQALPLFRQAYAATESPNARLYIARCLRELGQIAEAYDEMYATVRQATAKAESEARYVPTRDAAAAELALLELKVSKLILTLTKGSEGATVWLDDRALASAEIGTPVTVLPGAHSIIVRAPGYQDARQQVRADAGRTQSLSLSLGELVATEGPDGAPPSGTSGVQVAGCVLGGVGVAAMVVFAITYVMADNKFATVEEQCGGTRCTDPKYADTIDSGKTLEAVANVSVIAGSALIVGGLAMILFGGPGEDEPASHAFVQVAPQGAALGVQGRF